MEPLQSSAASSFYDTKTRECSLGRVFRKIASSALSIAKVVLIAGLCFSPALAERPFVSLANHYIHGKVVIREGTAACHMQPGLLSKADCERFFYNEVNHTELIPYLQEPKQNGVEITFQDKNRHLTCVLPSIAYQKVLKAYQYIENGVLYNPEGLQRAEDVLKTIHTLHSILSPSHQANSHTYRTDNKILIPRSRIHQATLSGLKSEYSAKEYAKIEQTFLNVILQNNGPFTTPQKDLATLNRAFQIGASPSDIPVLMDTFAATLASRMKRGGDYIDHASFAVETLKRISPYKSSMKELSWIFANTILALGEEPPLVFNDNTVYEKEVVKPSENRAFLTHFFRKQVAWTSQNLPHLKDPLIERIRKEARYILVGIQLVNLGKDGCNIGYSIQTPQVCLRLTVKQKRLMKVAKFIEEHSTEKSANLLGVSLPLFIKDTSYILHFGINPQRYINYQNGYLLLQSEDVLHMTPHQAVDLVHRLHSTLLQGIGNINPSMNGKYRVSWHETNETIILRAESLLSLEDFKRFLHSLTQIQRDPAHILSMTQDEKILWHKVTDLPTHPNDIAYEMNNSLSELLHLIAQDSPDWIHIAGLAHEIIMKIMPYESDNELLARLLTNYFLHVGNKGPVVFHSEKEYKAAIEAGRKTSHSFIAYLRERAIAWTEMNKQMLDL